VPVVIPPVPGKRGLASANVFRRSSRRNRRSAQLLENAFGGVAQHLIGFFHGLVENDPCANDDA
jgi:hypothetical protein